MNYSAKRPPSVWIAQILLSIFSLIYFWAFIWSVPMFWASQDYRVSTVIFLTLIFLFAALFFVAVLGMAKRKTFGRWLGVGLLGFMFVIAVFVETRQPLPHYAYKSYVEWLGVAFAQIVFCALLLFLSLRLAFARRVSHFFASSVQPISSTSATP